MNRTVFWVVVAVIVTWYVCRTHARRKRQSGTGGKLLAFRGGRTTDSTASIESRPIPQGEDLPTAT